LPRTESRAATASAPATMAKRRATRPSAIDAVTGANNPRKKFATHVRGAGYVDRGGLDCIRPRGVVVPLSHVPRTRRRSPNSGISRGSNQTAVC
jgi:hypothetical protein